MSVIGFDALELAARKKAPLPKGADSVDRLCLRCIEDLYRRFWRKEITHDEAKAEKRELAAEYDAAVRSHVGYIAVMGQFQEAIRLAGEKREFIVRRASDGATALELLDECLDIISAMTLETVTADSLRRIVGLKESL